MNEKNAINLFLFLAIAGVVLLSYDLATRSTCVLWGQGVWCGVEILVLMVFITLLLVRKLMTR